MALDGLVIIFYSWAGMLLLALHLAIVVWIWIAAVEPKRSGVGMEPLVAGTLLSAIAIVVTSVALAWLEFAMRTTVPGPFWKIVPGWTIYMIAIVGTFSAVGLTVVGVPVAAIWVRRGHRHWLSFGFVLLAFCAVVVATGFAPVVPSFVGFFIGVWLFVRRHRRASAFPVEQLVAVARRETCL